MGTNERKSIYGMKILAEDFAYLLNNRTRGSLIDFAENLNDGMPMSFEDVASRYDLFSRFFLEYPWGKDFPLTAEYDEEDRSFLVGIPVPEGFEAPLAALRGLRESLQAVFMDVSAISMFPYGE